VIRPKAMECSAGRRRRGFTLVEVLAALVLVALILPAAMRGITTAVSLAALSRQRMEATVLAETVMDEIVATGMWQDSDMSGDFGQDHPGFKWSAQVQDWQDVTLQQLDVDVTWQSAGRQRLVTLTTLIYTGEQ
jgi:general secretion pathway protein I